MLKEELRILWRTSAVLLGMALPLLLLGRAVMFIGVIVGVIFGFLAAGNGSLRSTMAMLKKSTMLKLGAGMAVAFFLSSLFAIDPTRSFETYGQLLVMGVGAAALFVVMREMPGQYTRLTLQALCLTTLFVMILALLDAFWADPRLSAALHGTKGGNLHRLNYMSSILAVLLPFLWAWLHRMSREQDLLAQRFAFLLSLVGVWAVFVCGGRIGWVAVSVSAVLFLAMASRHHHLVLHTRHWLLGLVGVILGPVMYGLSRGFDVMWDRLNMLGEKLGPGSGRWEIWQFAWQHMFDNPLTGIGLGAFRRLPLPAEGIPSNAHPHNFILQLGLETGLLGLVAALVFIGYIFWIFWGYAKKDVYGLAGLCALVAFFTASLANTSIFQAWWLVFFVFTAIFAARIGWSR